jgi:chlorophyll(ide) b reductase
MDLSNYTGKIYPIEAAIAGAIALGIGGSLIASRIYKKWVASKQPLRVAITGGSRGLGLALAKQHLSDGDSILVIGRDAKRLSSALHDLREHLKSCDNQRFSQASNGPTPNASPIKQGNTSANSSPAKSPSNPPRQGNNTKNSRIEGLLCDVSKVRDVQTLARNINQKLGGVDIFYCNAGLSQKKKQLLAEVDPKELEDIIDTNLLGSVLCTQAAIAVMAQQDNGVSGHIVLMAGAGSNGRPTPGNLAYGASKAALVQLKASLAKELKGTSIAVHLMSPGMVSTDLLLQYATNNRSIWGINALAEEPDTVAKWAVGKIRWGPCNGEDFFYLTAKGAVWRLFKGMLGFNKGRFVKPLTDGAVEKK